MRRRRPLGLGEQLAWMKLCWPTFRTKRHGSVLRSVGELQPFEIAEQYTVSINLKGGEPPEIRVIKPRLRCREDSVEIPHMYGQERLCLYLPGADEWTTEMPIALTILPWTSLWLSFYEIWLATGEWLGGGVHPCEQHPIRRTARREYHKQRRKRRG